MATAASALSGRGTTLSANETTSNCSWLVVSEIFVDNNKTGEETVCLSDMVVYSDGMWAIAGVFCWAAVAVACWNMYRHFDSYAEPKFQVRKECLGAGCCAARHYSLCASAVNCNFFFFELIVLLLFAVPFPDAS